MRSFAGNTVKIFFQRFQRVIAKFFKHQISFSAMITETIELTVRHGYHLNGFLRFAILDRIRTQSLISAQRFVFFNPPRKSLRVGRRAELFLYQGASIFQSEAEIVITHALNNDPKREFFALDVPRGEGAATQRIAAEIHLRFAEFIFPHASFNEINRLAVGAGFGGLQSYRLNIGKLRHGASRCRSCRGVRDIFPGRDCLAFCDILPFCRFFFRFFFQHADILTWNEKIKDATDVKSISALGRPIQVLILQVVWPPS